MAEPSPVSSIVGRGAQSGPTNRFERITVEADYEQQDLENVSGERRVPTQFFVDQSRSLIATNDSPDVGFRYSINPYRGCEHGCVYCYARPGHEFLGFNLGIDFETRIMVKRDAPALLRAELNKPSWRGEVLSISGVTDCYQPAERKFRLTRACLEVLREANQACGVITKNALLVRDIDLLADMAKRNLISANLSITTLDPDLARTMEPRTSPPAAKLKAIRELNSAGVPVNVMVAPVVPGLTDSEIPAILKAAADAGATSAGYVLLRLPYQIRTIFDEWLARCRPIERDRVLSRIRGTRDGALYNSEWNQRMFGSGQYAEQIAATFKVFKHKYGLDRDRHALDTTLFQPPRLPSGQGRLF